VVCSILLIILYRLTIELVLVNNLHINIKPMYRLYCLLKEQEEPPTLDDIAIASGRKKLDADTEAKYLKKFENVSGNIRKAFEDQRVQAHVCIFYSSITCV
jgi:hypothetical protein